MNKIWVGLDTTRKDSAKFAGFKGGTRPTKGRLVFAGGEPQPYGGGHGAGSEVSGIHLPPYQWGSDDQNPCSVRRPVNRTPTSLPPPIAKRRLDGVSTSCLIALSGDLTVKSPCSVMRTALSRILVYCRGDLPWSPLIRLPGSRAEPGLPKADEDCLTQGWRRAPAVRGASF